MPNYNATYDPTLVSMFFMLLAILFIIAITRYGFKGPAIFPLEHVEPYIEPKYSIKDIKRRAIADAANGDRYARDWVTKNILNKSASAKVNKSLTDQKIIDEGVEALCALKMKKPEALSRIMAVATNKKYNDVGTLIIDCLKKKG